MIINEHELFSNRFPHICWNKYVIFGGTGSGSGTGTGSGSGSGTGSGSGSGSGSGGSGSGTTGDNSVWTPQQEPYTYVNLFTSTNLGGEEETIIAPVSQIFTAADYTPYFNNGFNDQVESAQIVASAKSLLNGITLFLFQDAGFQNSYVASYFQSNDPYNFYRDIWNYGNFDDVASSALIVQHNALGIPPLLPVGVSLNSLKQSVIEPAIKKSLAGHPPMQLTSDISFIYQYDTVNQDYFTMKLPLQILFRSTTPDIKFNLYLNVKISFDPNAKFPAYTNAQGQHVPASTGPGIVTTYLSFSLPLSEFSNWGSLWLYPPVILDFYASIYHHISKTSFSNLLQPIPTTNPTLAITGLYTIPFPLRPPDPSSGLINSTGTSAIQSALKNAGITNYQDAQAYNFNFDYSNPGFETDILVCLY